MIIHKHLILPFRKPYSPRSVYHNFVHLTEAHICVLHYRKKCSQKYRKYGGSKTNPKEWEEHGKSKGWYGLNNVQQVELL